MNTVKEKENVLQLTVIWVLAKIPINMGQQGLDFRSGDNINMIYWHQIKRKKISELHKRKRIPNAFV